MSSQKIVSMLQSVLLDIISMMGRGYDETKALRMVLMEHIGRAESKVEMDALTECWDFVRLPVGLCKNKGCNSKRCLMAHSMEEFKKRACTQGVNGVVARLRIELGKDEMLLRAIIPAIIMADMLSKVDIDEEPSKEEKPAAAPLGGEKKEEKESSDLQYQKEGIACWYHLNEEVPVVEDVEEEVSKKVNAGEDEGVLVDAVAE